MGAIGNIWGAVKAGIILLLAARHARKLSSGGEFVAYFVALLAVLLFIGAAEHELLLTIPGNFSQFEALHEIIMSGVQFLALYLAYVLSAQINDWFEEKYMNGPYVLELVVVVVLIIFVLTVIGLRFSHNAQPRVRDIEHALLISTLAVELKRQTAS